MTASFFVATNGNDSWSGRLAAPNAEGTDGPFASPERALAAMRGSEIRTAYLRGGTYTLTSTLSLGAADSGISLLGWPGEVATLSGGERIAGFADLGGGVYGAAVAQPTGLDLSIGGVRQTVAQTGDRSAGDVRAGWQVLDQAAAGASRTALRYRADAQMPASAQPGMMIQAFDTERLSDGIAAVAAIDPGSRTITLKSAMPYALRTGGTYRILNDDALIRDTGEFAWRAEDGRLLVKPADPAALLSQGAVVPRLGTLVRLDGATGVTVAGLAFADTPYTGTAIELRNAAGNRVAGNYFSNLGTAVRMTAASGNRIEGNRMEHLGASGIEASGGSGGNLIDGNRISDIGTVRKDVAGIIMYGVRDNTISSNLIDGSPRYGISIKNWDAATVNSGNRILYNRITNTGTETADSAAIELLGRSNLDTATEIRGNRIEGVRGLATDSGGAWLERQKSFGIYLDDMVNGVTVADNFIRDTGWASIFVHGGDNNRIDNNFAVIANPRERFVRLEWAPLAGDAGRLANNSVTRNLVSSSTGADYWELWTPGSFTMTGNLIQGGRGYTGAAGGGGGTDRQGDPLFADPAAGNYGLLPGSVAFQLGIHDLDWARMGVTAGVDIPSPVSPPVSPVMPGGANRPPTAETGRTVAAREGIWIPLGIAAPGDPDGDALSVTLTGLPAGTVRLADGTPLAAGAVISAAALAGLTVTAPAGLDGEAGALAYTVADGRGGTAAGTLRVTARSLASDLASFDPLRYLAANPDLAAAFGTDTAAATRHYAVWGRAEGRGSSGFDGLAYLASHPELTAAYGLDEGAAALHYLRWGRAAGWTADFSGAEYLASYGDLMDGFGTDTRKATEHYLRWGIAEGRRPGFDGMSYLASHPELTAVYGADRSAAALHYVQWGRKAGWENDFDGLEYLASYGDLMDAFGTDGRKATEQYVRWGIAEGRRPGFDGLAYLASHPELTATYGLDGDAATLHYIRWGRQAGWGVDFDPQAYMTANPDVAAAARGKPDEATRHYLLWGRDAGRPTGNAGGVAPVAAALQAGADGLLFESGPGSSLEAAFASPLPPDAEAGPLPAVPLAPEQWRNGSGTATALGLAATDAVLLPATVPADRILIA